MMSSRKRKFIPAWIAGLALHIYPACEASDPAAPEAPDRPHFDVTWVGGPTLLVRFGGFTLLTDPTLGETFAMGDPNDPVNHERIVAHRRSTPLPPLDLHAVDVIVLSHIHPDHFDERAAATLDRTLPVLVPASDRAAMLDQGFTRTDGLNWGDSRQFDAGGGRVKITAVAARHSADPVMAERLGLGNGYWIEFSKGDWQRSLYWTGDSMPTRDVVQAIQARGTPDVLVPHVGGVGTTGPLGQISMRAADVVALAAALQPKYVLPIHHSTYAFYREPIGELARQSSGKTYRLDLVSAGSTVVYNE